MTQTYIASNQDIELLEFSNHSYINSLLNSSQAKPIKWKSDPKYTTSHSSNNSTIITYSFPNSNGDSSKYSYTDSLGVEILFTQLKQSQIADIKLAMKSVSNFTNISFTELADDLTEVGTIRIAIKTITNNLGEYKEDLYGIANSPSNKTSGGDIFFNDSLSNANFSTGLITDSHTSIGDISVFYHQLFHTLGIDHPNDNPSIPFDEENNSKEFTLMATEYSTENVNEYMLNQETKYTVTSTPMIYDIAALQHLYGANTLFNSEDTTYSYSPNTPFIETIWDGGGNDTLDFSNFNNKNTINLTDGHSSTIGFDVNWSMNNNFGIAFNAIIENAKGGSGADTITGNKYQNNIQGNAGNDTIAGGAGNDLLTGGEGDDEIDGGINIDTANYSGDFSDYLFTFGTNNLQIKDQRSGSPDGSDKLSNIEYIQFSDQKRAVLNNRLQLIEGEGPTDITLSSTSFNENIDVSSTVATLSSTDTDSSDTHTYTLVSGSGDTDNTSFTIDGSSLKINSSPDYETKSSYNIRIKTTDSADSSFEKSFTLSVNDLNETTTPISSERAATSTELQQLYIAYFSRPADPSGLDYWTWKGISRSAFAANMYLQPEFNNVNSGLSVEAQVNQIYKNLFSREADITGLTYWAKQIRSGALQLASIANDLIWAAENNSGSSNDKTALTNKTNAAVAYTAKIRESTSSILAYQAQSTNPWVTGNNLTEAKNYISGIDLYNPHTSLGIENSIAKFSSLSALSNYKLAIDSSESKVDIITGIEANIYAADTVEVTDNDIAPYSSQVLDHDYLLDIDNQTFISHLYEEVLDREPDPIGMNYWIGQLNSGDETRYEVLLGFTESAEHKSLFPEPTGFN